MPRAPTSSLRSQTDRRSSCTGKPPNPLWELTRARILEFVRDPSAIFWVFFFPVILAVVLGIAFRSQEDKAVRAAVVGQGARELAAKAARNKALRLTVEDERKALQGLRSSRLDLVIRVERGSGGLRLVYLFDPSRPEARTARLLADAVIQKACGRIDVAVIKEKRVKERGGRYIDFLIPGLLGLNIMGSCMWGMGYAIVDSRRRKLLKRFAVTPMNRSHFLLAFFFSRLVFLTLEVSLLVLFGYLVFGVKVHGSLLALAVLSLAGTAAFSGLALLIASRTESTEVASGWMNFVQLPMWLLSGSFFAYTNFPKGFHPFIQALPLTAINDATRAIMNNGAGFFDTWLQLLILGAWGALSFAAALKLFRWQ